MSISIMSAHPHGSSSFSRCMLAMMWIGSLGIVSNATELQKNVILQQFANAEGDGIFKRSLGALQGWSCDHDDSFQCFSDLTCIPSAWACNGFINCADGSDEADFCPNGFLCDNDATWLPDEWTCNGYFNCADKSDERNCPCWAHEFRCSDLSLCVPPSRTCDGIRDCDDGSDEIGCTCKSDEFTCQSYVDHSDQCVDLMAVCDGVDDCSDGSDESSCGACLANETRCTVGAGFTTQSPCIPTDDVCNDMADCADHSDETAQSCEEACTSLGDDRVRCVSSNPDAEERYTRYVCLDHADLCDAQEHCLDFSIDHYRTQCCNSSTEFMCQGSYGMCIVNSWVCDWYNDCVSHDDECGCFDESKRCELTGQCVTNAYRCNGNNDCFDSRDWTDECNCSYHGNVSARYCNNTGRCLVPWQICDGVNDCGDFSDETDCFTTCNYSRSGGDFQCSTYTNSSEMCVNTSQLCDGHADCRDGSDEIDCHVPCSASETRCATGVSNLEGYPTCLATDMWCDGIAQCLDHSDEDYTLCEGSCPYNPGRDLRRCLAARNDGEESRTYICLDEINTCDSVSQCFGGEDESECCSFGYFTCDTTRCIPNSWRCDDVYDCIDYTDEHFCVPCSSDQFECDNGYCVPKSKECNGFQDCTDGSDERSDCPESSTSHSCEPNQYRCSNGECVHLSLVCDGIEHCYDGTDEWYFICDRWTPITSDATTQYQGNTLAFEGDENWWHYMLIGIGSFVGVAILISIAATMASKSKGRRPTPTRNVVNTRGNNSHATAPQPATSMTYSSQPHPVYAPRTQPIVYYNAGISASRIGPAAPHFGQFQPNYMNQQIMAHQPSQPSSDVPKTQPAAAHMSTTLPFSTGNEAAKPSAPEEESNSEPLAPNLSLLYNQGTMMAPAPVLPRNAPLPPLQDNRDSYTRLPPLNPHKLLSMPPVHQ